MDASTFDELLVSLQNREAQLSQQGRSEYTETTDVLDNFKRIGVRCGVPPEVVWAVYAGKHFDGIMSYIRGHRSQRESVKGRIEDLRLYLALLYALVVESCFEPQESWGT